MFEVLVLFGLLMLGKWNADTKAKIIAEDYRRRFEEERKNQSKD